MRFYLSLLFAILSLPLFAQVEASSLNHRLGVIERGSDRVVDIHFTNHGSQEALMLRSGFSFEYSILFSSRSIAPDSTITLRVKYNPRSKGKFSESIPVFFSSMSDPIYLKFEGEVKYIDNSDNPACPDFRSRPADCCRQEDDGFLVEVRDKTNGLPVHKAVVRIAGNGKILERLVTDREGRSGDVLEPSWYFMDISADGYIGVDSAGYINRRNNYFIFYLDREAIELVEAPDETQKINPVVLETELPEQIPAFSELPKEVERDERTNPIQAEPVYKENNLVLLVDVSQSMVGQGKLDLLKLAINELTEILSPQDRVSLLTYATNTQTLFEGISGAEGDRIMEEVNRLEAGGMTMGTKGFDKALEVLDRQYIQNGNNELIVVTDGAFRSSDNPKIIKLVQNSAEEGVVTSILSIKGHPGDELKLADIVVQGNGSYLQLHNMDDAQQVLISEIRKQSLLQD